MVRSLKDRLRAKFNVSVAETGMQDVHARAEISIAVVTSDRRMAESMLDKIDDFVDQNARAVIVRVDRELYS